MSKHKQKDKMRSGLEESIAKQLDDLGVVYEYEQHVLSYELKVRGMKCAACGSKECTTTRKYTPDFWLPDYGFFIEAKGKWTGSNRNMHLAVRRCNPEVKIRFLFQYDNWLTKKHKSKYSDWCENQGYTYALTEVPEKWFTKIQVK